MVRVAQVETRDALFFELEGAEANSRYVLAGFELDRNAAFPPPPRYRARWFGAGLHYPSLPRMPAGKGAPGPVRGSCACRGSVIAISILRKCPSEEERLEPHAVCRRQRHQRECPWLMLGTGTVISPASFRFCARS